MSKKTKKTECGITGEPCVFMGIKGICCNIDRMCCYSCDDITSCGTIEQYAKEHPQKVEIKISNEQIKRFILDNLEKFCFLSIMVDAEFLKDGLEQWDENELEDLVLVFGDQIQEMKDLIWDANPTFVSVSVIDEENNYFRILPKGIERIAGEIQTKIVRALKQETK